MLPIFQLQTIPTVLNVLFFAFANSREHPLPSLQAEDDRVYATLSRRALQLHYLLHRDLYASLEKIARDLTLFRDYVSVFHFSGHAG